MPFTAAHELFSVNDGLGTTFRKVPPNETKKPDIWLAGLKGVKSSGKISGFPGCWQRSPPLLLLPILPLPYRLTDTFAAADLCSESS